MSSEGRTASSTAAEARRRLVECWTEHGAITGELSTSALSTAVAAMAFAMAARASSAHGDAHERLARRGRQWLCGHQNADGGFGDTVDSPSNISTTTLAWASLAFDDSEAAGPVVERIERWLQKATGGLTRERLAATIRARYGKDHTFSVPILTTCALAGRIGEGADAWRLVPSLPFELAACPHQLFALLGLPTVSYALPALIAIGQARHHHRPTRNPLARAARNLTKRRTLHVLTNIQPASGGFLEAAPLTSFVTMSLISIGLHEHPVVTRGLSFLADTVRDDGSWPIDTNLDTWSTTLSINALGATGSAALEAAAGDRLARTRSWLLGQQYAEEHPYTHAAPGGWAWTDLTGGVPDADDTAGAVLALHKLGASDPELGDAAGRGLRWLFGLQNRDGGVPTFCRGWGTLPFDRSSPDLTAHALRAFAAWRSVVRADLRARGDAFRERAIRYLLGSQRDDGAWVPLWFGNQGAPEQENPLHGTSRVLRAVATVRPRDDARWREAGERGLAWILAAQHEDGGFGAAPGIAATIEETALAVDALAAWQLEREQAPERASAIARGSAWLIERTAGGTRFEAAPIGLYFAKLWYSERIYPLVFTVAALELAEQC